MFRKYYKLANDNIETNRELIDRIFESKNREKTPSKTVRLYKYGTMVAAVFVVVFSVAFYTNITKYNETVVTETNEKVTEKKYERKMTESIDVVEENISITEPDASVSSAEAPSVASVINEEEMPAFECYALAAAEIPAENSISLDEFIEISDEAKSEIVSVLTERFGRFDAETGNEFIFEIVGAAETENGKYYLGRWKWFVVDHSSMLCDFVLSADFSEMYECRIDDEFSVAWTSDANLLTQ